MTYYFKTLRHGIFFRDIIGIDKEAVRFYKKTLGNSCPTTILRSEIKDIAFQSERRSSVSMILTTRNEQQFTIHHIARSDQKHIHSLLDSYAYQEVTTDGNIRRSSSVIYGRIVDPNSHSSKRFNKLTIVCMVVAMLSLLLLSYYDPSALSEFHFMFMSYNGVIPKILTLVFIFSLMPLFADAYFRAMSPAYFDERYKGVTGKVRYAFSSFAGFVDVFAVGYYFFYCIILMLVGLFSALGKLTLLPESLLSRLNQGLTLTFLLVFLSRFSKVDAFVVLKRAIQTREKELFISIEAIGVVTIMLSILLLAVEHKAQPDVYKNGATSVIWAFAQYIGDPGHFADTPPITITGRIIACIIGLLGITLLAVPTGIVASAFSDTLRLDEENNKVEDVVHAFCFQPDASTHLLFVPPFVPLDTIIERTMQTKEQVMQLINRSHSLRVYPFTSTSADSFSTKMVVVNYLKNKPYGYCINRHSRITIVCPVGTTDPLVGWFAYHVAKIGGFNYISKEVEQDPYRPMSYYDIPRGTFRTLNATETKNIANLNMFLDDIDHIARHHHDWIVSIVSVPEDKDYSAQFHFCYNTSVGDDSYNDPKSSIKDYTMFDAVYQLLNVQLHDKYNITCNKNKYYAVNENTFHARLEKDVDNIFTLRIANSIVDRKDILSLVKTIADVLHDTIEPWRPPFLPREMQARPAGPDYGMQSYLEYSNPIMYNELYNRYVRLPFDSDYPKRID